MLTLDAAPPVTKKKLGHRYGFEAAVLLVCICVQLGLIAKMICTDRLAKAATRILWEGEVLNSHVQF